MIARKNKLKFKDLFKNTFKKHTEEDLDEVFVCGSDKTTPNVKDINPKNASAWVYFKIFVFFIIAYIPTRIGFIDYGNINYIWSKIIASIIVMFWNFTARRVMFYGKKL